MNVNDRVVINYQGCIIDEETQIHADLPVLETLGWTRRSPPWTRTGPTPKHFFEISA